MGGSQVLQNSECAWVGGVHFLRKLGSVQFGGVHVEWEYGWGDVSHICVWLALLVYQEGLRAGESSKGVSGGKGIGEVEQRYAKDG